MEKFKLKTLVFYFTITSPFICFHSYHTPIPPKRAAATYRGASKLYLAKTGVALENS